MRKYTDLTVLLDRSGSMQSIKKQMESAYNEFLQKHKEVPSTRITLIQFDDRDDQDVVYTALPVSSADTLDLKPRGSTPLLDAFCKAIDRTGRRLTDIPERDRPDQVLFVVITDGQENASREFKRRDVFQRVGHQREKYKWQFVYLGANQDAIQEAATFNIPVWNAITYVPQNIEYAAQALAANTMSYTTRSTAEVTDFTEEQRKKALTTPTK